MQERRDNYFYDLKFLMKALLGYLAYIAFWPQCLSPLLHKLRGVRIKDAFDVYIAPNVVIDTIFPELVSIEEDVFLTRGVKIIAHMNPTRALSKYLEADRLRGYVVIKSGAFVGVNVVILPNVTVGRCALVAAGAIVSRDVPDFAIVAGNPARVIGDVRYREERTADSASELNYNG
jgi:acetyltransferase-like isoleucine patch superfamily enzyme